MHDPHDVQTLPDAPALDRGRQVRLVGIIAAGLLGLLLLVGLIHRLTARADEPAPAPRPGTFRPPPAQLASMKIVAVRDGAAPGTTEAIGTISVNEDHSTPVILPFSGQVADVMVQAGQHVVRGQPLLRIASPDYVEARNTLLTAAATQATTAAQLRIAGDNAKRAQAIYETAGGALKDYRQSQSDLVAAQAAARSAQSALDAARSKLALLGKGPGDVSRMQAQGSVTSAQTTYDAPVSGVIATRDVAPGQYVGSGGDKPLMTIADLSTVWLVAQLPETDAASVHVGDAVVVTTPAYPGRSFRAVINNIAAALDPATHRLPVRATVTNTDGALKPQMFASFAIQRRGGGGTGLLVPSAAVIHEGDTARVWVLGRDNLLTARTVTVGDSGDGYEKITSGLRAGERVVTAGALFVNEAGLGA